MIRRYHRWLSLLFGLFLVWIAATGLLSHGAEIYRDTLAAPAPAASAAPPGFICPEVMTCRAKPARDSAASWVGFFHHLHAGEEFGPAGKAVSILSGLALLFFALSGLWMYLELYRGRLALVRKGRKVPGGKVFWK
jgi:hypothetical protein